MLKGAPFSPHKDPGKKMECFFLEEHFIVLLSLGFSRKPPQKKQQTNTEPVVKYFGDVYTKQNAYLLYIQLKMIWEDFFPLGMVQPRRCKTPCFREFQFRLMMKDRFVRVTVFEFRDSLVF